MKTVRKIELLAPAKDKQIGKEAILHGADAVYIGIEGFSARSAAGNSIEDIAELIDFAKKENIRVIFIEPQFAQKAAQTIAQSIGGAVATIDPLQEDWPAGMTAIADALAKALH